MQGRHAWRLFPPWSHLERGKEAGMGAGGWCCLEPGAVPRTVVLKMWSVRGSLVVREIPQVVHERISKSSVNIFKTS